MNAVGKWLFLSQLWIPFARRPNAASYAFGLVRYVIYVTLSVTAVLAAFNLDFRTAPGFIAMLTAVGLYEELFRFSIMYRADRPYRSGLIFTTFVEVVETSGFLTSDILHQQLLAFAELRLLTTIMHYGITLIEAAAIRAGSWWRWPIFGVCVLLHVVFDCIAWYFIERG